MSETKKSKADALKPSTGSRKQKEPSKGGSESESDDADEDEESDDVYDEEVLLFSQRLKLLISLIASAGRRGSGKRSGSEEYN